jgi:hypothetical protein
MDFKLITSAIGILLVFVYAFGSGIWVLLLPAGTQLLIDHRGSHLVHLLASFGLITF